MQPRIGSVPYLNARPLTYALTLPVTLLPPRRLAEELHAGRLDVALVPVVEVLQRPDDYLVVDQVAIGSLGAVRSVILAHRVPLMKMQTVALDSHSKTSVHLARVILERFYHLKPLYVPFDPLTPLQENGPGRPPFSTDGLIIIGDPALTFRSTHPDLAVLDLAQVWNRETKLPTVFAVWAIRRETVHAQEIAVQIRQAAREGLAARRKMAPLESEYRYLTESLHYGLEGPQKEAIALFASYLAELGLIDVQVPVSYL